MALQGEDVYCTLVMSDAYLPGAAVLAHSLRDAGTKKKLAAMVTLNSVSADAITELKALYDLLIPVERISNPNPANLFLMDRGDLLHTFTKINLWRQTQFRKIVYIDSDVVALRAPDELFDTAAQFAASPDVGWPDAFNTGVMVISPNMGDYWALQTLAASGDSFDGADQGLLNQYYEHKDWQRLSFAYNCTPNAEYQWEPAYRFHKANIKMVHFIGKNKPWTKGRQARSGSGVYSELLGRWWAVYDRHLRMPTPQYIPGKPFVPPSSTIQKHVAGEATDIYYGFPPEDRIGLPPATEVASQNISQETVSEIPTIPVDQPFTEPGEEAKNIEQGVIEPMPTEEQRQFSAPQMEWDATRTAPPPGSKAEAANFPTHQYTFSDDNKLFHPPTSYPEPPKDMWYQTPSSKPEPQEKPKAIFPWEREENRPRPSRVFVEDLPAPPALEAKETSHPASPSAEQQLEDPSKPFAPQVNAWDNVASIDRYVRAVMDAQTRRTTLTRGNVASDDILSPHGRRESLILTDFPTFDDRPSLPVTPAPIRRPTFWGEERDAGGELPAAQGVPDQAEWNPTEQLETLRRSSLVEVEHLKSPDGARKLPARNMPEHASLSPSAASTTTDQSYFPSGISTPHGLPVVPEEEGSTGHGGDGAFDELSPSSSVPPISNAAMTAEVASGATTRGTPIFSEPDFAAEDRLASEPLRRSAGSFSADTAREDSTISPTER